MRTDAPTPARRPIGTANRIACVLAAIQLLWLLGGPEADAQQDAPAVARGLPSANPVKEIQSKLRARGNFHFHKTPLSGFVAELAKQYDLPLVLDGEGLTRAGIADDAPVTADFMEMSVNRALMRVLKELSLRHEIRDGQVVITNARVNPVVRVPPPVRLQIMGEGGVQLQQNAVVAAENQEAQLVGLFRPLIPPELQFLKYVCKPDDEQCRGLERDSEEILRQVAKESTQQPNGNWVLTFQLDGQIAGASVARDKIRARLVESVKTRLSAEKAARYARELELRAAQRRRMSVLNVVARIDSQLFLSAAQRDAISEALLAAWDESWALSVAAIVDNNPSLPMIPEALILPHLTVAQQRLWQSTPKGSTVFNINGGWGNFNQWQWQQGFDVPVINLELRADDVLIDVPQPVPDAAEAPAQVPLPEQPQPLQE